MRNAQHGLSARQQFRQAGRRVLNAPADLALHEQRVNAALGLEGAEPLQGALADWLHGCAPDAARFQALLARADIQPRLAPFVLQGLQAQAASGRKLPAASAWATRRPSRTFSRTARAPAIRWASCWCAARSHAKAGHCRHNGKPCRWLCRTE